MPLCKGLWRRARGLAEGVNLGVDSLQVNGTAFAGFRTGLDVETDLLAILKGAETGSFHGADVDEHVGATVIRCNKAETFLGIEPFDGSGLLLLVLHGYCLSSHDGYNPGPLCAGQGIVVQTAVIY